ncbi:polycystin-1-like protein 3 isoform X2 [Engraulis encrasicolus]|uniref:polycystin-1-like protein 3 isoform X2 n=1 Tax=Engraulis encrasicolus TaxID=184585 RepID=UPI002FD5F266
MGNVLSCCCAEKPCERQDEEQRLIGEGVASPQTSLKVSEGGPVNPDCVTTESSESPSPTTEHNDQSNTSLLLEATPPEEAPCPAALQKHVAATSASPVKLDASVVVVVPEAALVSAQDDGNALSDHEKVASGLVSEALAGATKIVASESFAKLAAEGGGGGVVVMSSSPQTHQAASVAGLVGTGPVLESKLVPVEKTVEAVTSLATDSHTPATGIQIQASPKGTVSQATIIEKADNQASSSPAKSSLPSAGSHSGSAEKLGLDLQSSDHAKLDTECDSTETEAKAVEVCHVNAEGQNVSATAMLNEATTTPLVASPRKELLQDAVVHLNGSLPVDKVTEEASSKTASATEDLTITSVEPVSEGTEKQGTPTRSQEKSNDEAVSQAISTPTKSPPASAVGIDNQPTDIITDIQTVSVEQVGSQAVCGLAESQAVLSEHLAKADSEVPNEEAMPLVASPINKAPAELHLNGSFAEESATCPALDPTIEEKPSSIIANTTEDASVTTLETIPKEQDRGQSNDIAKTSDVSLADKSASSEGSPPQETISTIPPGVKQEANESPKSLSPISGDDVQVGSGEHEALPDGSTAQHQDQDAQQPHPETDLHLDFSSTTSDGSPSAKASKDSTARPAHKSDLKDESCQDEDLKTSTLVSVTTENTAPTETGGSPVGPSPQEKIATDTDTISSLGNLVEEQETGKLMISTEDKLDTELKGGITDEGPVEGSKDEEWDVVDGNDIDGDLYRGEDEIEEDLEKELIKLKVEQRCSLEPPMAILAYSEREWKGQTAKSAVIRKGYAALSQGFSLLQRVRGDNYCALRATLYQALMSPTGPPDWLQQDSFLRIPEDLESRHGLMEGWLFPEICLPISGTENTVDLMKHYLGLLQKWWLEAAAAPGGWEGRRGVCEQLFQGGDEEFGLMEALKLLMLHRAMELHSAMQRGDDVPIFCWLLFARDTSPCPRTFLANHLSQVGFTGGMEQVEMFLLGYALQHTIKAFRLYMADTEEFITHYPDDHIPEWPCVCLVTEDDRHYNVAVGEPASDSDSASASPPQEEIAD